MSEIKDLKKMSLEELMEVAKLPVKTPDKKLSQVKRFIISEGLKDGTDAIPATLIYSRYTDWCKINIQEATSKTKFFKEFKLFYKKILRQGLSHYQLSAHGFDFSLEKLVHTVEKTSEKRTSRAKKIKKESIQA